jgi:glycosyltransferase involved in cell wall biosynthesis
MLRGRSGRRDFSRVIVVAALGRNNGIASGARLQWAALRELGVETELLDATSALRNPLFRVRHRPGSAYVFHSAGPQIANLIASVLPHAARAYRIGYWAWELPDPPRDWSGCDRNLAEIWTPSAFSQASLAQLVSCPLQIVPHYIPPRRARTRSDNPPFTVLAMADSRSSWSRKNPEGALRAFRTAFGTSPAARLLLKLGGRAEELRALEASLGHLLDGGNVEIVRGHLDEAALTALYRKADVLLSLHRAEGYGLPLNEAMAHGLPVVATGWSGNLDFMDAADSFLVSYRLVPVSDVSAVYRASTWAEPDLDAAARALHRLATEPELYARLATAAHRRASAATPRFPFTTPLDVVNTDALATA